MALQMKIPSLHLLLVVSMSGCAPPFAQLLIPDSTFCIAHQATWSPDGEVLAISVGTHDGYSLDLRSSSIYLVTAEGALIDRLSEGRSPAWSPDGSRIAFTSGRDGSLEVYVMNADGTEQTNLTNSSDTTGFWTWRPVRSSFVDTSPAWSPDGRRIAFSSDRDDGNQEIYVMNADDPKWAPDGSRIAFTGWRERSGQEIWLMSAAGTRLTRLTRLYDTEAATPLGTCARAEDIE